MICKRWQMRTLGPICQKIGSGITPRGGSSVYVGSGTSLIRSQNVYNSKFSYDGLAHIDEKHAQKMSGVEVLKNDILLNITGDSVARCCIVPEKAIPARVNQHVLIIRAKENTIDQYFLMYYLISPYMQKHLLSIAGSGGTRKALTKSMIEELKITLPDIEEQKRIADILSAYDDLIENNRRRIALLEQSARELYREWFVRFRFPGHAKVKIVDGLPEGWEKLRLSDLCHVARGASPRPILDYMNGEIPWFKIADATASESIYILKTKELVTEQGAKKSVYLKEGSVILSNSATCGIPYFNGVSGCIHDGWLYFTDFTKISKEFLYFYLYSKQRELLQSVGDGSTQKNLNTTLVSRMKIILPDDNQLHNYFQEIIIPILSQVLLLSKQNTNLRNARDLLLPRLMNGEISV